MYNLNNRELTLKNIKTFMGSEGYGLNADLYVNGKKVAFVRDAADGGPIDYDVEDAKTFNAICDDARKLPPLKYQGMDIPMDIDMLINKLYDLVEKKKNQVKMDKAIKRLQETSLVFGAPGTFSYNYINYNTPLSKILADGGHKYLVKAIADNIQPGQLVLNTNIPLDVIAEASIAVHFTKN